MHAYSTNESRVAIYGVIAVTAVILAWLVMSATEGLDWPQWLVSAPSLAATFTFSYGLFDRVLWKLPLLQRLHLVDVADISGTYEGNLISTYTDTNSQPVKRDITLCISQTWTKIDVEMTVKSGASSSRSNSAVASVSPRANSTHLVYVYRNSVNPGLADADMGDHDGAAELVITSSGGLSGRYFNVRPRAGTIQAQRTNAAESQP